MMLAAIVTFCGATLMLTSCSDDDEPPLFLLTSVRR